MTCSRYAYQYVSRRRKLHSLNNSLEIPSAIPLPHKQWQKCLPESLRRDEAYKRSWARVPLYHCQKEFSWVDLKTDDQTSELWFIPVIDQDSLGSRLWSSLCTLESKIVTAPTNNLAVWPYSPCDSACWCLMNWAWLRSAFISKPRHPVMRGTNILSWHFETHNTTWCAYSGVFLWI